MSYLLALDQGTSSTRSIVFDRQGRIVGLAQRELTQHYPQPGWVEHDPMEIWRSQQDTLRVDGPSVYMKGGKISGSTDPLWGYGGFYCDGCELMSRSSGHSFIVARSTKGFAVSNCKVTKETTSVNNCTLAQVHSGAEPGKIVYANCKIDNHVVGWRTPVNSAWYEYNNTDLAGKPVMFNGTQLKADSAEVKAASSAQGWLGWSP